MDKDALSKVAKDLVAPGKGILAADESMGTIKKRFDSIGVESTSENHKVYRQLLFTTGDIGKFVSGVILFDETIRQKTDDGVFFPEFLEKRGILPGIKVDLGKKDLANFPSEVITEGLDGLRERLSEYVGLGAKFTKWRALIKIGDNIPTTTCILSNAESLARFASLSQESGLVPIIEPEVSMEGTHSMDRSREVTKKVLKEVFIALDRHKVDIKGMLLKPSWVHPGFESGHKPQSEEVASATLSVFKEVLPDDLPGIVFLSGGDSPTDSTSHLDKLNESDNVPWQLSFSFGRALQGPVLKAWGGKEENVGKAQKAFYKRAKLNSLARSGEYKREMENE
jgi:fructose-bisphosphate aldolase class I